MIGFGHPMRCRVPELYLQGMRCGKTVEIKEKFGGIMRFLRTVEYK